jgi:S-adenosylmethionine decarboxylase
LKEAFHPSNIAILPPPLLLLLAESHILLHTYLDQDKAFFDSSVCGLNYEPANIFRTLAAEALHGTRSPGHSVASRYLPKRECSILPTNLRVENPIAPTRAMRR